MEMWDVFSHTTLLQFLSMIDDMAFKSTNEVSYARYRTFFQVVDIITLNYESLNYSPKYLVACVMYIVVGGPQMLGAFPHDYQTISRVFSEEPPIM